MTLIDLVVRQIVFVLTVVVVLVLQLVLLLVQRAVHASGLVDAVVDAGVPYALAATVVEPSVAGGTHALARRPALVPRVTLGHERDGTVHRHHVRLQRVHLLLGGLHVVLDLFLVLRREQGHVEVYREREREPALERIWLRGQRLEQAWHRLAEVLHVGFFTQWVVRDVRLGAEVYARTALIVQVAEAGEALLAAGTGDEVTLAALRKHALAHHAGADHLVAGLRVSPRYRQKEDSDDAHDQRPAPIRHRVLAVLRRVAANERRLER